MESLVPQFGPESEAVIDSIARQIREFVASAGFDSVMLGLSGGMDSAFVAALAVEACGADKVHAYMLPTRFTSDASLEDARRLALNLNISCKEISIEESFEQARLQLARALDTELNRLTLQNLQVRIRALYLMALSNQENHLVLNTSNKSEALSGFSTLYGDMIGAFGPLLGLYKTQVYELAAAYNRLRGAEIIPASIFEKDPSPELEENQRDSDVLPLYPVLDSILYTLIDGGAQVSDLRDLGVRQEIIDFVDARVKAQSFKQRYLPPAAQI